MVRKYGRTLKHGPEIWPHTESGYQTSLFIYPLQRAGSLLTTEEKFKICCGRVFHSVNCKDKLKIIPIKRNETKKYRNPGLRIRIRIPTGSGSQLDPASIGSVDPDPGGQK